MSRRRDLTRSLHVRRRGNESTVASVTFDYDTIAPMSTDHRHRGCDTAIDTDDHVFTVNFSEPVDPATLSGLDFSASGPGASVIDVQGAGALVDGGYTSYEVTVTGSGEGTVSLALDVAASFADVAGNIGSGFTAGETDTDGQIVIDTIHLTVDSIERVSVSDSGTPRTGRPTPMSCSRSASARRSTGRPSAQIL